MMDVSERLLIAGKLLGKTLAGYRDDDLRSAARGAVDLGQLMFDANDEIEQLRAERERLQTGWTLATAAVDRNETLQADNERLREAHERIVERSRVYPISAAAMRHVIWQVGAISRAALEPKP